MRRRPYCVILLDEIEKAHAEVFDVLLQVLDEGRLTDGQGRTVDFRNAVLIMTSNIRSAEALAEHFRPEFLNRIDEIVEFKALSREQLADIVELQLGRLRERLAERGLALELTDAAKEAIAEAGWDPAYGARPLKRAIQRLLENRLALRLLEGDFGDGDTIRVDAQNGDLVFERRRVRRPGLAGLPLRPRPLCLKLEPQLGERVHDQVRNEQKRGQDDEHGNEARVPERVLQLVADDVRDPAGPEKRVPAVEAHEPPEVDPEASERQHENDDSPRPGAPDDAPNDLLHEIRATRTRVTTPSRRTTRA